MNKYCRIIFYMFLLSFFLCDYGFSAVPAIIKTAPKKASQGTQKPGLAIVKKDSTLIIKNKPSLKALSEDGKSLAADNKLNNEVNEPALNTQRLNTQKLNTEAKAFAVSSNIPNNTARISDNAFEMARVMSTSKKDAQTKPSAPVKTTTKVNTEVRKSRGKEPELRIKLGGNRSKVTVKFPDGGFLNNHEHKRLKIMKPNEEFTWVLNASKGKRDPYMGKTLNFRARKSVFEIDGKKYRGALAISFSEKGAVAINTVKMESYLRGVVGREMGSKSPSESLKAQTVIARTYAYSGINRHNSEGADLCDTTHCQVYAGMQAEAESVDAAVEATRGYIIMCDGKPIVALYHATCGGYTSDNTKVFGGTNPYLKGVKCDYCKLGTMYRWNRSVNIEDLKKKLSAEGIKVDFTIYEAELKSDNYMDRVEKLILKGKDKSVEIKGTTFRRIYNLPSTTFVSTQRPIKLEEQIKNVSQQYQTDEKTGIIIIGADKEIGKQYMVLTASGLKRSLMPESGWNILTGSQEKAEVSLPVTFKSSFSKVSGSEPLSSLEIFGRGFGHQVGMCQSGAVELGKKGWSYRQIISMYYTGVTLYSLNY